MTYDEAMEERALIAEALRLLGVDRLVLSLQDASFPAAGTQDPFDPGRGSPYSAGARAFFAFARALGFTGIQFGPQGLQEAGSASPYEAALFSRNPLDVAPGPLIDEGLLTRDEVDEVLSARPPGAALRADHAFAHASARRWMERAWARARSSPSLNAEVDRFVEANASWLVPDGLYEVLQRVHPGGWWRAWTGPGAEIDRALFSDAPASRARLASLQREHADSLRAFAFEQWVLSRQHAALREELRGLGLRAYGDLQIGLSARDEWAHPNILLRGYRLGAPPSRTNPEGQPWNYPTLDPASFEGTGGEGPGITFLRARVRRLLEDHDGLRVDHPHGLVCPWVYRDDASDPVRAVQLGARLFGSPDLPDHPALARYAIARADQLDLREPRFSDTRVRALEDAQVARYARLMDVVMEEAARVGARDEVLGEVLSTMPYPLRRVFERHGLGRFRVLQKANLRDPSDVYRAENAAPADWVMLGNHDTPPIWKVIPRWRTLGTLEAQVEDLARRLGPTPREREALVERLRTGDGAVAEALLASAFACPARNVQIFFADLLGLDEVFNVPGTVSPENWRLRVPPDHALVYAVDRRARRALNLPGALALALRSRGEAFVSAHRALIAALEAQ